MSNSRPWINETLRDLYADANPACELAPLIRDRVYSRLWEAWLPSKCVAADEAHHIFHPSGERWDLKSNLICLCRTMHDWCHANEPESKVACLYAKWKKSRTGQYVAGKYVTEVPDEFDLGELNRACGKDVLWWLKFQSLAEPFAGWRDAIVESFRAKEAS